MTASAAVDPPPGYVTVSELMRLDGEQALEAARKRRRQSAELSPAGAQAVGAAGASADTPRLVGIYGVGKRLFAEVRSGSRALLFLKGHSLPVGHVAGHDPYRLKEMADACVRLEREGAETVLCLPRTGDR